MASQVISSVKTVAFPAEAPAPSSLRGALDALANSAANGLQLAISVVDLQRDLIAAETSRLIAVSDTGSVGVSPAGPVTSMENNLCVRALTSAATVAEPLPAGAMMCTPLGISMRDAGGAVQHLVGLFSLVKATPLAMAMAQERLELSAALARALVAQKIPPAEMPDPGVCALTLASTPGAADGLARAATDLTAQFDARNAVIVTLKSGRAAQIADPANPKPSPEYVQRVRLAACEVLDFGGTLSCGRPGDALAPAGIARAFPGQIIIGHASASAAGDGVVVLLVAPQRTAGLAAQTTALAVAVVARAAPSALRTRRDVALASVPPLARLDPTRRWPVARAILGGAALLLCLMPVPRTVSATATIEPVTRRIVSAPIVGRIEHVRIQPGDQVIAGKTVMIELDTQALQAERDQALAALQAAMAQAATARADGDTATERTAQLRGEQAQAQVALLDYRISEAAIVAPISGTVMGEDLRRREGAQVSRGENLFEIAAPGGYRAELLVPDRDIARVRARAGVNLHLSAYSLARFSGTVTRIYPLAEQEHGNTVFRVIAQLDATARPLQPGMAGQARISSSWQPLGWIALAPVVDVARRFFWI